MRKKFFLSGGLGNQLFQYFAAARTALENGEDLVLNAMDIHLGKINHNSCISSIDLPIKYLLINEKPSRANVIIRKLGKSVVNKFNRFGRKNDHQITSEYLDIQTSMNFDMISSRFPEWSVGLFHESIWSRKMLSLANNTEFIAVHIRRGDYRLLRNIQKIGMLDLEYYLKTLINLRNRYENLPIWVFTDEPSSMAENLCKFPKNSRLISPPSDVDPAEVLLLMSKAKVIVLSNSTFSWWGARFSNIDSVKVAPSPWYRNLPISKDFIPGAWEKSESVWSDEYH